MRAKMFLLCSLLFIAACEKEYFYSAPVVDLNAPVSYATQIQPIWTKSCSDANCHATGFHAPDLTTVNSYIELTQDPGQYVNDSANAEESQLYKRIISTEPSYQMPRTSSDRLSTTEISLVLAWIKQGAKNN